MWLDALTTNVDRTPRNPNLIVWHRRPYLIDHGSALYIHHSWADPDEHARRPFPQSKDHVLMPFAGPIAEADERLAPRVDREVLERITAAIPDDWLQPESADRDVDSGVQAERLDAACRKPHLFFCFAKPRLFDAFATLDDAARQ